MNNVSLIGRLTKDPEIRTAGETMVCNFTLAVNRRFKSKGQPDADFITCVAFGKTAEIIGNHLHKGEQMGVVGRIQTSNYTNNQGQRIYRTDVVVDQMHFIGTKNQQSNGAAQQNYSAPQANYGQQSYNQPTYGSVQQNPYQAPAQESGYSADETLDLESDDLPF